MSAAFCACLLAAIAITSTVRPFKRYGPSTDLWLAQGIFVYDTISPAERGRGSGRVPKFFHYQKSLWRPRVMGTSGYPFISIPLWPFIPVFAVIAGATYRRVPTNACRHCRYNLSGLPPASPCPECGSSRTS